MPKGYGDMDGLRRSNAESCRKQKQQNGPRDVGIGGHSEGQCLLVGVDRDIEYRYKYSLFAKHANQKSVGISVPPI
jgi:hypothetical protein